MKSLLGEQAERLWVDHAVEEQEGRTAITQASSASLLSEEPNIPAHPFRDTQTENRKNIILLYALCRNELIL